MKSQIRIAAFLVSAMASGAALSAVSGVQGTGGTVEFSGEIVDSSCNVTTGSKNPAVDLGRWAKTFFIGTGVETTKTPFTISVDNCPASVKTVAVLFTGVTDANNPTLLALNSNSVATGVGIKLYNAGSTPTPITLGSVSAAENVVSNKADLKFMADYVSTTTNVTAGSANGSADFLMVYN